MLALPNNCFMRFAYKVEEENDFVRCNMANLVNSCAL